MEAMAHQNLLLDGSVYVGDSWRIISSMRSDIVYPAMWLERPIIETGLDADEDTTMATIKAALSIVGGVQTDDWAGQDAMLETCSAIVRQIIARLKRDADLNYFDLDFPITAEPLAVVMADDCFGWRIEFTIIAREWTECFHEEEWVGLDYSGTEYTGIDFDNMEEFIIIS